MRFAGGRSPARVALLVVGALGAATPSLGASGSEVSPAASDRAILESGAAVVRLVARPSLPARVGIGWRVLDAPADRILRAIVDLAHYPEWAPFVTASGFAAGGAAEPARLVEQRLDLPFPIPDRRYRLRVARAGSPSTAPEERAARRIAWEAVPGAGNIGHLAGSWTLTPWAPGRTLVRIEIAALLVPALPAGLQDRPLRRALPWVLDGLRQQVGRCRYDRPPSSGCAEAPPTGRDLLPTEHPAPQ